MLVGTLGEAQHVWADDRLRDRITDWFGALYAPNLTGGRGRTQHRAVLQTTFRGHLRVAPFFVCLHEEAQRVRTRVELRDPLHDLG
jgi:hypothetical protein